MRAILSALCSALILVILTVQIGRYERNQKTSLNQNIGHINQEFIDELEKGFAPHADTRATNADKFHSYLNIFDFDVYDKRKPRKLAMNGSYEFRDDTSPAETWDDHDVREKLMQLLQGLVSVASDQEQKYVNFGGRVKSIRKEIHNENITNSLLFNSFSTEIKEQEKQRRQRFSGLWSSFQKMSLNTSQFLAHGSDQMKQRISELSIREARDYMLVLNELDLAENRTSAWYNASEDGVALQDDNLRASAARFQAALAADMQSVEADDTQAETRARAMLDGGMRSIEELKKAIGASLEAARATAYSLHRGTVDSLGPIRQSLSRVGSEEDEVATNIEGYRIDVDDRLRPVEEDAVALGNETRRDVYAAQQDLDRLLNLTEASARTFKGRVPSAEARNAAILEAESASIRELQAAMSEWVQAVASSTARLVVSEVSAAGAAGAALDSANATEARGFAAAAEEEEREQRLLKRVKAEDANAARARAEEETRLSNTKRMMEARIDARNSADGKELAQMEQDEDSHIKKMNKNEIAWVSLVQKSSEYKMAQLKEQESAFEKAENEQNKKVKSTVAGELGSLGLQVDALQSFLESSILHLQSTLAEFRGNELSFQKRFEARVQSLSAKIVQLSQLSESDLQKAELSLTDFNRRVQEWNKSAVDDSIRDRSELTNILADEVKSASANVSASLQSSVEALRSIVTNWLVSNTESVHELWGRAVAWDQSQKTAINEIGESLDGFDKARSSVLIGLAASAQQFNDSLRHLSSVLSEDLTSGDVEGQQLVSNLQQRIAEDSKASLDQIKRDVEQLRSDWSTAYVGIDEQNDKLLADGNQSLQKELQGAYDSFLESESHVSQGIMSVGSNEDSLKTLFDGTQKNIVLHSSNTQKTLSQYTDYAGSEVANAEKQVSSSLFLLMSRQKSAFTAIDKLINMTVSVLHENVSNSMNFDSRLISNISQVDSKLRKNHLLQIEKSGQNLLNVLESQVDDFQRHEDEKNSKLGETVNHLQQIQSVQGLAIEHNFSDIGKESDLVIRASTQMINSLQREMAMAFMDLEHSITSNISAVLCSLNSTILSNSAVLSRAVQSRAAWQRSKLQEINERLTRRYNTESQALMKDKIASVASIENQAKALQDLLTLTTATSDELQRRINAISNLTAVSFAERRKALDGLEKDMDLQNSLLSATIKRQTNAAGIMIPKDLRNRTLSEAAYLAAKASKTQNWILDQQISVEKDLRSLQGEVQALSVHAGDDPQVDRNLESQIQALDRREAKYFFDVGRSVKNFSLETVPFLVKKREDDRKRIQSRLLTLKNKMRESFNTIDASLSVVKSQTILSTSIAPLNMSAPILSLKRRVQDLLNYILQIPRPTPPPLALLWWKWKYSADGLDEAQGEDLGIARLGKNRFGTLEGSVPLTSSGNWHGYVAIFAETGGDASDTIEVRQITEYCTPTTYGILNHFISLHIIVSVI